MLTVFKLATESIVTLPAVVPSSPDVTAVTNWSADSSQITAALSPVEPLSTITPASFVLADIPLFNSNMLSAITVLVVDTVVVAALVEHHQDWEYFDFYVKSPQTSLLNIHLLSRPM